MNSFPDEAAAHLQRLLEETGHRIVFAESCTAGLIAATLGRIPGISQWLAGSAVVYQIATKARWLNVGNDVLQDPGPVSQVVSEQMALGVLTQTPHATMAAAVTGHLGPDAPDDDDGIAWSTVVIRSGDAETVTSRRLILDEELDKLGRESRSETDLRQFRQYAAAKAVLRFCVDELSE